MKILFITFALTYAVEIFMIMPLAGSCFPEVMGHTYILKDINKE